MLTQLKNSLLVYTLLAALLSGISSAAPIGYNTLDPRFHGTQGETRELGSALISVGYWQDGTGPRQAMMVSTVGGTPTYTLLNVPTFNSLATSGSRATGIAADGTITIEAGYSGFGSRLIRTNVSTPNNGTLLNPGYSWISSGVTGNGTAYGSSFDVVQAGANTFTTLNTGALLDGEIFDGRSASGVDRLVGGGTDGIDGFLAAWQGLSLYSQRNCGSTYCAPGRLDINGNFVTSVTYGGTIGWWDPTTDTLTLPNFDFGAGARDRGLYIDNIATRLLYTQGNFLGVYDSRTNTGIAWNPYCLSNATFCAAVATAALDTSKGNSNGINWVANVSGTEYQTINDASAQNVPEPSTMVLGGLGLAAAWAKKRLQRRA